MSTLAQRCLFGTLLLGGCLGLIILDSQLETSYGYLALVVGFALLGWGELARLLELGDGGPRYLGWLTCFVALVGAWGFFEGHFLASLEMPFFLGLTLILPALLLPGLLLGEPARPKLEALTRATFAIVYLVLPLICCLKLRFLPHGFQWIVFMLLVIKGNDIGAYLVGRKIGKTPLSPVSPKKTVEGSVAGLLLGTAVAVAFSLIARFELFGFAAEDALFGPGIAVVFGIATGMAGQVGDLAESYLKRSVGVKDSGSLVPTYGGALDMIDSVLVGAPVIYFLTLVMGI